MGKRGDEPCPRLACCCMQRPALGRNRPDWRGTPALLCDTKPAKLLVPRLPRAVGAGKAHAWLVSGVSCCRALFRK